jgi:hypothetical protein
MLVWQEIGRKMCILRQKQALRKIQSHRWMRDGSGFGVGRMVDM